MSRAKEKKLSPDKKNFYITTTLPYVNADPHIGFAKEIIFADVIARHKRASGFDVFFNTGTDEHGLKIYRKAREEGKHPQKYVDEYAAKFDNLKKALNLSYNSFIRTTDEEHMKSAQDFWKKCAEAGDIYKKFYKIKYCVGCEMEKTDSDLVNGHCPIHPNLKIEIIEEENYFFRWSKYQKRLLDFYDKNPDFVIPKFRFNEIKNFVKGGLNDFSISRLKEKMPWGVSVPGDDKHVMYVWFDALVNYISVIGWPHDMEKFQRYWPVIQVAGKDNIRHQSAMWQAMLMSAGLPSSKQIIILGFITIAGQKMSKSLGNIVNPFDIVAKYGTDALRYYLTREITPFEDGDFTYERFEEVYQADLANGLGNLVARTLTMAEKYCGGKVPKIDKDPEDHPLRIGKNIHNWKKAWKDLDENLENFRINEAIASIWKFISEADNYIEQTKPWNLAKEEKTEELNWVLYGLLDGIHQVAWQIYPFMPETALKIAEAMEIKGLLKKNPNYKDSWVNFKPGTKIKKSGVLFPRLKKNISDDYRDKD